MNPTHYVKFTGKFSELKSKGYKFRKVFANNYRAYLKKTGNFGDNQIWIWQANGGYLEIDDLYGLSYLIVRQIVNNEYLNWEYRFADNSCFFFMINRDNHTLINITEHNRQDDPNYIYGPTPHSKEYRKQWKSFGIVKDSVEELKRLIDNNLIELSDYENFK